MQTPPHDHPEFDALCETVGEFDPLPSVARHDIGSADEEHAGAERTDEIDDQILAGLVTI